MRSPEVASLLGIPLSTLWRLRARLHFPSYGTGRDVTWTGPQVAAAWTAWCLLDGNRPGAAAVACGRAAYRAWAHAAARGQAPPSYVAAAFGGARPQVGAACRAEDAWGLVAPLVAQGQIARIVRIPEGVARVPVP